MASVTILFLLSMCLIVISGQFRFVESIPLVEEKKVVYTRYVRLRPIPYSNDYVREVVEVFNTHRRPPPYAFLHDEDLTRFVRCGFDPSMLDCDEETHSATSTPELRTYSTSTTTSSPSTTSTSSFWWNKKSETTTEQNIILPIPHVPAVLQETILTTKSPADSEEYGDDNSDGGNDYDDDGDEKNEETNSTDTTDEPNGTAYYDEAENNSENLTEASDSNADAEAETESDSQIQETTTIKPAKKFLWF